MQDWRKGIYGLFKKPGLRNIDNLLSSFNNRSAILGSIDVFGRVIEAQWGVRGEKALITLIDLSFNLCEYKAWLGFGKWCEEKASHWCHSRTFTVIAYSFATPFCPKHLPDKSERVITVPELAKVFSRKYGCETVI